MPYKDREVRLAKCREWRDKNPDHGRRYKHCRMKWRDEMREFVNSLRLACAICGESDKSCLDFHHRDPKTKDKELRGMFGREWGKGRILAEVEKCDVLCSNCHRKLHASMRGGEKVSHWSHTPEKAGALPAPATSIGSVRGASMNPYQGIPGYYPQVWPPAPRGA